MCLCLSGDFINDSHVYEDLLDVNDLKKFMETKLEDYNLTPGVVPMSLVLFQDAIEHSTLRNLSHSVQSFWCNTTLRHWFEWSLLSITTIRSDS